MPKSLYRRSSLRKSPGPPREQRAISPMNYLGSSLGKGTSTDFSNIEKNILYLFSSGSVTDTIGSDFNLVTNETSGPFTLTLGGTALSSVNTGTNEWSFGTPDANGTYPYVVTYVPGTDEKFTWHPHCLKSEWKAQCSGGLSSRYTGKKKSQSSEDSDSR